ncbi:hypothetical protein YTPLAS18_32650 [Nitrospira sp.]|nr:hypothetical protein YTPLAS18_32650 [Nitrospira sp.]
MKSLSIAITVVLILAAWGCVASNASAEAARTTQLHTIMSLLAAEEHVATAEDLARIGPDVPELLTTLAQDHQLDIAYRARATSYLGYYQGNSSVGRFLSSLVSTPNPPAPLLRRGLTALAHVSKGKAIPAIAPHLKSSDVLVREAAARAMVDTGDPAALKALKEAAATEREPFLQKKMHDMAGTAVDHARDQSPAVQRESNSEVQSTHY